MFDNFIIIILLYTSIGQVMEKAQQSLVLYIQVCNLNGFKWFPGLYLEYTNVHVQGR